MENISLSGPILITFIIYSALMLYIGFYFFKQNKTTEDYFLGGRSMGPVVSALSAGASDMSAWLLMGLPGALYLSGLVQLHIAIGLTIGASLNWIFVAKRLRIYTSVINDSITIPDYFETRFDDDKHILRVICAIVTLVFFTFYVSSGLVGGAKLFEATFGLNYSLALSIGTIVIVTYTFFGGYKAVSWTDMIQGLLMMGALIVVPLAMLYEIGSPKNVYLAIKGSDSARIEFIEKQRNIPQIISILESNANKEQAASQVASLAETLSKMKDATLSKTKSTQEIIQILKQPQSTADLKSTLQDLSNVTTEPVNRLSFLDGASLLSIISALAWGLGYFGQPHILVRFMSIRSTKDIPRATTIGISWMVISMIGACLIGLVGVAYVNYMGLSLHDPEKIFIATSRIIFNPWIAGILLSAILAAIMSTASSQLLVSSSTIAEDFYHRLFNKKAPEELLIRISRLGVLAVSIVAFLISTDRDSSVLSIVSYAWAGFGASFGSVMLFSLFWRRTTRMGAILGMITGALVVVLHKNIFSHYIPIYEIVPGFLAASIVIVVVSLMQDVRPGTKAAFDKMLNEIKNS